MFCSKCGQQNEQEAIFCATCGTRLCEASADSSTADLSPHPVINEVKKMGTSPLFITAICAFSANLLFQLAASFGGSAILGSLVSLIWHNTAVPSYAYQNALYILQGVSALLSGLSLIAPILMAVGMWMTYAAAHDRKNPGMRTAGLTMIKVLSVLSLIWTSMFITITVLSLIAAIPHASAYFGSGFAAGVLIFAAVLLIAVLVFSVVYQCKVIQTISTIKQTIATGIPSAKVSSFVAVMCFVAGGFQGFSALFTLGIFSRLAALCAAAASVCFGLLLFEFKNKMDRVN